MSQDRLAALRLVLEERLVKRGVSLKGVDYGDVQEATQQTVWSPMILNGSGFGFFANHSLVLASYISRANAALIDLSNLLAQG